MSKKVSLAARGGGEGNINPALVPFWTNPVAPLLRLPEAKHPKENRTMRGEPLDWRVPELPGDNGAIELCDLVEAHHGQDLEARQLGPPAVQCQDRYAGLKQ
jgi:hypothetical protein